MSRIGAIALASVLALAAVVVPASAASRAVLTATPSSIDFHTRPVGTENYKRVRITNTTDSPVVLLVTAGLPDDFGFGLLPGSTCPALTPGATMSGGDSCYAVVRFSPSEFFAGSQQLGSLSAIATDPANGLVIAELTIPVAGRGRL